MRGNFSGNTNRGSMQKRNAAAERGIYLLGNLKIHYMASKWSRRKSLKRRGAFRVSAEHIHSVCIHNSCATYTTAVYLHLKAHNQCSVAV